MAAGNGGSYGTALLEAMALYLPFYTTTTNSTDRTNLFLFLQGIQFGFIEHDPNGVTPSILDRLADIYEWLPGNLFIGPHADFRSDDPGHSFESNAGVVVGRGFPTYINANQGIQAYLGGTVRVPFRAILNLAAIAIQASPFALNASNWAYNQSSNKFRLVTMPQSELEARPEEMVAAQ
jgi:hypothetical protein